MAAGSLIITGTNWADEVITETLTLVVNDNTIVVGNKAFKTVTSASFPPHDGATDWTVSRATVALGYGDKFGLPLKLTEGTVAMTVINNAIDNAATVATSATVLESNTVDPAGSVAGTAIDIYLFM